MFRLSKTTTAQPTKRHRYRLSENIVQKMMKNKKRTTSNSRQISAVLLGQDGVGKSAFTVRLLTRRYIGEYSNLEASYNHNLYIDGETVALSILDTSGSKSEKLLEEYLGTGDLYIIMYSITDRNSFLEARRLGNYLRENISGNTEIVLVGNKKDLDHSREILESEGSSLSEEIECRFYEISIAHHFDDVEFMMNDAVRHHIRQKNTYKPNKASRLKVKENSLRNKSLRSLKRRMSIS